MKRVKLLFFLSVYAIIASKSNENLRWHLIKRYINIQQLVNQPIIRSAERKANRKRNNIRL